MLRDEEFVHADCVWLDRRFVAYRVVDDAVVLDEHVELDTSARVDACATFTRQIDGVTYGGGESAGHGSYGFFFKRGTAGLDWALFSYDADPFIDVEVGQTQVRFRSQSGDEWIVEGDAVGRTRIERAPSDWWTRTGAASERR